MHSLCCVVHSCFHVYYKLIIEVGFLRLKINFILFWAREFRYCHVKMYDKTGVFDHVQIERRNEKKMKKEKE